MRTDILPNGITRNSSGLYEVRDPHFKKDVEPALFGAFSTLEIAGFVLRKFKQIEKFGIINHVLVTGDYSFEKREFQWELEGKFYHANDIEEAFQDAVKARRFKYSRVGQVRGKRDLPVGIYLDRGRYYVMAKLPDDNSVRLGYFRDLEAAKFVAVNFNLFEEVGLYKNHSCKTGFWMAVDKSFDVDDVKAAYEYAKKKTLGWNGKNKDVHCPVVFKGTQYMALLREGGYIIPGKKKSYEVGDFDWVGSPISKDTWNTGVSAA